MDVGKSAIGGQCEKGRAVFRRRHADFSHGSPAFHDSFFRYGELMAIHYDPKEMLKKIAPESKIKRLVSNGVTLKKAALAFVDAVDFLDRKAVSKVALNTIKSYKSRIDADGSIKSEILDDPKLLINRVQNEVVFQIKNEIRDTYEGEQYEWLPSDAEEPDPEHQLNYGKIFTVGVGEMPGDRIGCRCGMNILVNKTKLELG